MFKKRIYRKKNHHMIQLEKMQSLTPQAVNVYLDYINDFHTITALADYHGITYVQATVLIDLGRELHTLSEFAGYDEIDTKNLRTK